MGREVKRVSLDFDWPENKVWRGYLNPHYKKCEFCGGTGETMAHRRLGDIVSLLMLSGYDARRGTCHPYFQHYGYFGSAGKVCGSDMVELTTALAGRSPDLLGHDCCDRWSAMKKILQVAGLPEDWGECKDCDGGGVARESMEAYEAWRPTEPPVGEGYQIWETVSEGSPISPVFKTPEELARHMAGTKWGADNGTSYETWLAFINGPGWALSCVMDEKGIRTGVEAAVDHYEAPHARRGEGGRYGTVGSVGRS